MSNRWFLTEWFDSDLEQRARSVDVGAPTKLFEKIPYKAKTKSDS